MYDYFELRQVAAEFVPRLFFDDLKARRIETYAEVYYVHTNRIILEWCLTQPESSFFRNDSWQRETRHHCTDQDKLEDNELQHTVIINYWSQKQKIRIPLKVTLYYLITSVGY